MATSSHGLAVLTNACVKPPVDPKTGLSTSFHDRVYRTVEQYDDVETQRNEDFDGQVGQSNAYSSGHVFHGPANEIISRELNSLNDEEFYEKLLQLKNEHKKTLALCEKLYKRKITRKGGAEPTNGYVGTMPEFIEERDVISNGGFTVNGYAYNEEEAGIRDSVIAAETQRSLQDTYTKPPSGRPPISPGARTTTAPVPRPLTIPAPRPSSAPAYKRGSLTRSLDEEVWRKIAQERLSAVEARQEDEAEDREASRNWELTQSESYDNPELSTAMSRIEDMWENFSIENYAPRRERPSSASITRKEKDKKIKEWRHRITIPKPFNMTVREKHKEKKESKILQECQEAYLRKQEEEEMECEKKFKASPAPAHIYIPLYDEILEKNEARRRYVKQYSKDLLKSQEAPFSFLKREESKKQHKRRNSAPQVEVRKSQTFKANPVPTFLIDNSVEDKIREEEEYRKIRMKMRSKELLKEAALPPSMEARKQMEEDRKQRSIKTKRKGQFKPKINHDVPDYDELYRHFQKELARRKREREATVTKPFQLNTMHVRSSREKVIRDMEKDEETLRENRWPYKSSRLTPRRSLGAMSSSLDSIPAKSTMSADLRSSQTRKKMSTLTQKEQEEIEAERKRRIQEMRLRRSIQERTSSGETPRSLNQTYAKKVKEHKEEARSRQENYKREIQEMKERVQKRPLLFEQESQINARVAAQKKFSNTLKTHGIDEDFIQSRSSRTASLHADDDDDDDYGDDFETSQPKSGGYYDSRHEASASEEDLEEET